MVCYRLKTQHISSLNDKNLFIYTATCFGCITAIIWPKENKVRYIKCVLYGILYRLHKRYMKSYKKINDMEIRLNNIK